MPPRVTIYVMGRGQAEQLLQSHARWALRNHAVVSITDPKSPRAQFRDAAHSRRGRSCGVVRLQFADFGDDAIEALEQCAKEGKFDLSTLFSSDQASKVLDLVVLPSCQIDSILVHCEAGISRSVGMTHALGRILTENGVAVTVTRRESLDLALPVNISPQNFGNSRVRRVMIEEAIRRNLIGVPFASSS